MAKKETTKKSTKKVTKKVENEQEIKVEELEQVAEEAAPVEQKDITPAEVEVINGDPAVVVPAEVVAEVLEEAAPIEEAAPQEDIKPKKNVFRKVFGYIWNGQEMDY